jgi:hypothetical protein
MVSQGGYGLNGFNPLNKFPVKKFLKKCTAG